MAASLQSLKDFMTTKGASTLDRNKFSIAYTNARTPEAKKSLLTQFVSKWGAPPGYEGTPSAPAAPAVTTLSKSGTVSTPSPANVRGPTGVSPTVPAAPAPNDMEKMPGVTEAKKNIVSGEQLKKETVTEQVRSGTPVAEDDRFNFKIPDSNEKVSKVRANEMLIHLRAGEKHVPDKFKTYEAFMDAYGKGKAANEVAFLNYYWKTKGRAIPTKGAAPVAGDKPVGTTGDLATGANKNIEASEINVDTKDAVKSAVDVNREFFVDLIGASEANRDARLAEINAMAEQYKEDDEKLYAELQKATSSAEAAFAKIRSFQEQVYEQSLDELGKRKAGLASGAAGALSGQGVSSATIANAMAEIANNPEFAKQQNQIVQNFITNLQNTEQTYQNIMGSLFNSRSGVTEAGRRLIGELQDRRDTVNAAVQTLKEKGIEAIWAPVLDLKKSAAAKVSELEVGDQLSDAEISSYKNAGAEQRKLILYKDLYNKVDPGKRDVITGDQFAEAAKMDSLVDARAYLNNLMDKAVGATSTGGATSGTGGVSAASTATTPVTGGAKTTTTTATPAAKKSEETTVVYPKPTDKQELVMAVDSVSKNPNDDNAILAMLRSVDKIGDASKRLPVIDEMMKKFAGNSKVMSGLRSVRSRAVKQIELKKAKENAGKTPELTGA